MFNKIILNLNKKILIFNKKIKMIFTFAFLLCIFIFGGLILYKNYSNIQKEKNTQLSLFQKEMPIIEPLIKNFVNAPFKALVSGDTDGLRQELSKFSETQWLIEKYIPRYSTTKVNTKGDYADLKYVDFKSEFKFLPEKSAFSPNGTRAKIWVKTINELYYRYSPEDKIFMSGEAADRLFILSKETNTDRKWLILGEFHPYDDVATGYIMNQGLCFAWEDCLKYMQLLSK